MLRWCHRVDHPKSVDLSVASKGIGDEFLADSQEDVAKAEEQKT